MDKGKQLRSIVTLFQKLAECPICLDTLTIPFRQCARGHLMCSSCAEPLTCCPTCEADLSIENPIGVKNFIEALPKFCHYSSDGCQYVVECGGDHETHCGFRPETCRVSDCNSVVPVNQLEKHYMSNHTNIFVLKNQTNQTMVMRNLSLNIYRHKSILILIFGQVFYFVYTIDANKKEYSCTFDVIPIEKPKEDYYVQVKFEKGNFVYIYTLKACERQVNEIVKKGDESESSSDGIGHKYYMMIPTSELKRFINTDKIIEYELTFFKDEQQ